MIDGVVATTLVNEAASKIVSSVMTSSVGTSERFPYVLRYATPLRSSHSTPPGHFLSAMACSIAASISASLSV